MEISRNAVTHVAEKIMDSEGWQSPKLILMTPTTCCDCRNLWNNMFQPEGRRTLDYSQKAPLLCPSRCFLQFEVARNKIKTLLSFQRCPLLRDKRKHSLTRTFILNWTCAIIWGNVCCEQVTWCIWTKLYKKDNKYITILWYYMGDLLSRVMWRVELKVMRWSKFATLVWLPDLLAGTNCDVGNDDDDVRWWWSWKTQTEKQKSLL